MKRRRAAEAWNEFVTIAMHPQAPEGQRREMRRAFYAGADAILIRIMQALGPDTGEPTAEDLQVMTDLQEEFAEFARAMKAGRA